MKALKFWLFKQAYWLFQKTKDERTLIYVVEQHGALSLRVARFKFGGTSDVVADLKIKAEKKLADHDTEVTCAHERYCKYIGTPRFRNEELVPAV